MVVEANDRQPVPDAGIVLLDEGGSERVQVVTDAEGRFGSALPAAGRYSLRIVKLGYRTLVTETFEVRTDEILELEVRLGIDAVPLDPLQVTARRSISRANPVFERRVEWGRQSGFGRYFTKDEIERRAVLRTSTLLMEVPSIRLVHDRFGNAYLGVAERGGYNCRSAVYLNDVEISQSQGLDELSPDMLEGIEVYRWRSEMPAELATQGVCSAVAFWTRAEVSDRGWGLKRILIGGALAAGLVAIGFLR